MGLGRNIDDDSALKTLKIILNLVIHRAFLSEFTWTGKSKPGTSRKIALRNHKILEMILKIVMELHPQYDQTKMENHLVNKILKNAYE